MSFPSEILRTSTNIVERALKEIREWWSYVCRF
jgi:hypothetical protein